MRPTILLLCALLALPQEKRKIDVAAKKGDRVRVTETGTAESKYTVTPSQGEKKGVDNRVKQSLKFVDEVLEVGAEGAPTEVKRKVLEWRKEMAEGEANSKKETVPAEGKTLTLKMKDGKTHIEGIADLPAEEKRLLSLRRNLMTASIPKRELSEGATWTVDEKDVLKEWQETKAADSGVVLKTAKLTGTLKKLSGARATVVYDYSGEGSMNETVKVVIKATIVLEIDAKAGRLLKYQSESSSEMWGEFEQDGQKKQMDGKFSQKGQADYIYE